MRETFIEPSGETVFVGHIEDLSELSVGNTVATRGDERIKLHITFGLFRLCEPVHPAGDEQCGADRGRYEHLSIRCLKLILVR